MIISDFLSSTVSSLSNKYPKADFATYCHDLARQESASVNPDYLTTHFGFSFADLFDHVIVDHKKILSALQSTPYCIIAHSTPEYDPDYSHVGVYLKNKYDFSGEIMDVVGCDESILCTAFHLLSRFFQRGLIDRGAIILFEQAVIPVSKKDKNELRKQSRVDVFLYSIAVPN